MNSHTFLLYPVRRALALCAALVATTLPVAGQGALQVPPPTGHVNDFAAVIGAAESARMDAIARFVRTRSGGEIAIVTLSDIAGRDVAGVALQIGRDWKVGAKAEIGDRARNAGVVVLLVPRETSTDGNGHVSIMVGEGAEGFIPDAVAGDMRREATEYFRRRAYGEGLLVITARLAERYAAEFGFSLDSLGLQARAEPRAEREPRGVSPVFILVFFFVLVILLSRGGRGGCAPFLAGQVLGHAMGRRGRYHGGGGFGGGFGGGGGGFGGFGGGGGFSGGGSSGSF